MCCKTYIQLNGKNSTFVNLQGLPDNSLLLSIRIDQAGKDLKPQQKYRCYWPDHARGKLYADLVRCSWPQMTLHVLLPETRIKLEDRGSDHLKVSPGLSGESALTLGVGWSI